MDLDVGINRLIHYLDEQGELIIPHLSFMPIIMPIIMICNIPCEGSRSRKVVIRTFTIYRFLSGREVA